MRAARTWTLAILLASGCGGASVEASAAARPGEDADLDGLRFTPAVGSVWAFRRHVQLVDPSETHDDAFTGTWTIASGTEATLAVVVHPDDEEPVVVAQHFDERGLPTDAVIHVEGFSNDTRSTFVMSPIGTAAVGLPLVRDDDGGWSSVVRSPELARIGLPTELPMHCTATRDTDTTRLTCSGSGASPTVTFHVDVAARVDATGVARECTYHHVLEMELDGRHGRGEATVHTELAPAS